MPWTVSTTPPIVWPSCRARRPAVSKGAAGCCPALPCQNITMAAIYHASKYTINHPLGCIDVLPLPWYTFLVLASTGQLPPPTCPLLRCKMTSQRMHSHGHGSPPWQEPPVGPSAGSLANCPLVVPGFGHGARVVASMSWHTDFSSQTGCAREKFPLGEGKNVAGINLLYASV